MKRGTHMLLFTQYNFWATRLAEKSRLRFAAPKYALKRTIGRVDGGRLVQVALALQRDVGARIFARYSEHMIDKETLSI